MMTKKENFTFADTPGGEKNIKAFTVWINFCGEPLVDEIRFGFSDVECAFSRVRGRAQNGVFFASREDAQRAADEIREIFAARKAESQNDFVRAIDALAKEIAKI